MRNRGAKYKNIIKIIFSKSKVIIIFSLAAVILISVPLVRKINQKKALDKEIAELTEQAERIEQKNSNLSEVIDYLQSNTFAEKEARLNLDMKKTGEKVLVVKNEADEGAEKKDLQSVFIVSGLENLPESTKTSNKQIWRDYFFGAR